MQVTNKNVLTSPPWGSPDQREGHGGEAVAECVPFSLLFAEIIDFPARSRLALLSALLALSLAIILAPPAISQDLDLPPEFIAPVLPRTPVRPEKPATAQQIELGRKLFFDKRLSIDDSVSCSTCHDPEKGWSDGLPTSKGVNGQHGSRNAPTLVNVAEVPLLFWDGRSRSLEDQIREPIENPIEMAIPLAKLPKKLQMLDEYEQPFLAAYGAAPNAENTIQSIAAFVRTIKSGTAPFDRFRAGDKMALTRAARRGHDVFFFRTNCSTCHRAPLFTDHEFHNLGVGIDENDVEATKDLGRFAVSDFTPDRRAFKTPTLRDISRSAPYMHDGRFKTLKEVVEFYAKGGVMNPQLDPLMNIIPLTEQEKSDLVVFLEEALTTEVSQQRDGRSIVKNSAQSAATTSTD